MNRTDTIASQVVPDDDRLDFVDKLFGANFPMRLEPTVCDMAGHLSADYGGGYWRFHSLSNGGLYMSPCTDAMFALSCENGYEGKMSADAFGIVCCLYSFSHLSFGQGEFAQTCARHYHLLRDWAMAHIEAREILRAID